MYLAYFDETGDDGYPNYSSEVFVLSSIYLHHQNWKTVYKAIYEFRKYLRLTYSIPIKLELHTKKFILNKRPYRQWNWPEEMRLSVCLEISDFLSTLDIKVINVCILKQKITEQNKKYYSQILDKSLSFNVQRIENDIKEKNPTSKFMIITDEGRVPSMQKTTRRIQKINFIPSRFTPSSYRREINLLIEDPLPKNSKDSYFIQLADFISFFVYLKMVSKSKWHNRLQWFEEKHVDEIIEKMKPILNSKASSDNDYGFVCYPK